LFKNGRKFTRSHGEDAAGEFALIPQATGVVESGAAQG